MSYRQLFVTWVVLLGTAAGVNPARAAVPVEEAVQADAARALVPFTPEQLERLLPATVYFRGQVASVQARNSGAVRFPDGAVFFAAMVDTSGYASDVQATYQFYLVTESPILLGSMPLRAGAYGAGVVNGKLVVMDIGGHTIANVDTTLDNAMMRPRPLQVLTEAGSSARLYLGRRWVGIVAEAAAK